jgi:hypothetical protein
MRSVSIGGAMLETAPLPPLGEEIRVEIAGELSSFTMDAVVVRREVGPGVGGAIGIRFVDRDPRSYAKWLRDECVRLSMWMCSDTAPLAAAKHPVLPAMHNDPVPVPVQALFELIESQPGRSLSDLPLQGFDETLVRVAVARLLESRAVAVTKAETKKQIAAPPQIHLFRRMRRPL